MPTRRRPSSPAEKDAEQTGIRPTMEREVVRLGAFCVVIIVAALAVATVQRPDTGYVQATPLLTALAAGAALGLLALTLAGVFMRVTVLGGGSRWRAMTAGPTLAIVLTVFVAAAASPRAVHAIAGLVGDDGAKAEEQTDFRRWQGTVLPIAVSYASAVAKDAAFARGLPAKRDRGVLARVIDSERRLAALRRGLVRDAAHLPSRPELERLTNLLARGLTLAERAQHRFLAAAKGVLRGLSTSAYVRLRWLRGRGVRDLRTAQETMATFALEANKLGASLFVQPLSG